MTQTPTDALCLVPVEPTREMIEAGASREWSATYNTPEWKAADRALKADYRKQAKLTFKAMLAAAPASPLPEGGGWQDISTAPKDGSQIILWCIKPDVQDYQTKGAPLPVIGNWIDGIRNVPLSADWIEDSGFTHWMPLPSAPTGDAA